MTHFVIDRCVPIAMARVLRAYETEGNTYEYLDDNFKTDEIDPVWLEALGQRDLRPVVLSGDGRILKRPSEAQILKKYGFTAFFCHDSWPNVKWSLYAWQMLRVWPKVLGLCTPTKPSIYVIPPGGASVEFKFHTEEMPIRAPQAPSRMVQRAPT